MIRVFEPFLSKNLGNQIKKIVDDNWISSQGEKVKEFENRTFPGSFWLLHRLYRQWAVIAATARSKFLDKCFKRISLL